MNFLTPGAFFLGLLLPVIIALYLLKLRRVERTVASNYLWRRMVRDVEANAPWQKLRRNLLMILQLLFLAALILALARPFSWSEGAGGLASIFVIDTSASMASTDVNPSRIESAKQRALQLIADMPDNARATIIEAGSEARVLLSSSTDRRKAQLAVENIQAGIGGSDMGVALELASAIAARQPGAEIVVLSDGKVDLPDRLTVKGRLRYIPFGISADNQAISLLSIETNPAEDSLAAFVQVSNYSEVPASRRVSIFTDGNLLNVIDMADIPPGGQKSAVIDDVPAGTRLVQASLDENKTDALPLDDKAIAAVPDFQDIPVRLVTRGNLFIKTALSLLPGIQLTEELVDEPAPDESAAPGPVETPASAQTQPEGSQPGPALTIYDQTIPDQLAESGSLLFIAPPKSTQYFTVTGKVNDPRPRVSPTPPTRWYSRCLSMM